MFQNRIIDFGVKPADQFLANPKNARLHPQFQRDVMKVALETVGFVAPVVESRSGFLLDGHERIYQALAANNAPVPYVVVDVTEAEEDFVLATFDPITSLATYDQQRLDDLLHDVQSDDAAIQQLLSDLAAEHGVYLGEEPTPDPGPQLNKAEELQQKWQVQAGDLWEIGAHRLLCGDSTKAEDVARLGEVDALFTDPPYGINRDPSWLDDVYQHRQALVSRDILRGDDGSLDLRFLFTYKRRMIWGFPYIYDPEASGWIVWDKQPGVDSRGIVTPVEMASTTMRRGFDMIRCMWGGYYRASGEIRQPHPSQKPLQVLMPFIEQWTKPDEVIYDPFLGSGTTLVACEQLHRRGRGIEIEPKYCAVALERLAGMGLEPVRVG